MDFRSCGYLHESITFLIQSPSSLGRSLLFSAAADVDGDPADDGVDEEEFEVDDEDDCVGVTPSPPTPPQPPPDTAEPGRN